MASPSFEGLQYDDAHGDVMGWQRLGMQDETDSTLMDRIARQDRQAFEVLYQRYGRRLGGYLTKVLRRRELVEEVVDDVMLVVWLQAARFDAQGKFSTWLFGIAYHKAMKALSRPANKPLPQPLEPPAMPPTDMDPEHMVAQQELKAALAQAITTLSAEQRAVVELTFYHDCSYQEIASIAGCPVNTVKTRMFHARRRLAQCVTQWVQCAPPGPQEQGE